MIKTERDWINVIAVAVFVGAALGLLAGALT
jgi:hypothetical protein